MNEHAKSLVEDAIKQMSPITLGRLVSHTGLDVHTVREAAESIEWVERVNSNTYRRVDDTYIRKVQEETHAWREEQFDNLSPIPQTMGTMIELGEFGKMLVNAEYYDSAWADRERLEEEAGDVIIYFLGVLSLLDLDVVNCIERALDKNEQRDWNEHMEAP